MIGINFFLKIYKSLNNISEERILYRNLIFNQSTNLIIMKKIFFVLFVSVLFSCKKDKKCNQDMGGIAGTYGVTAIGYKVNASAAEQDWLDDPNQTEVCAKDDQMELNANGTARFVDAGVKCNPAGDYSSTWSVSGSTITVDGDPATIQSFNCSTLVVTATNIITAGDQIKVTNTRL